MKTLNSYQWRKEVRKRLAAANHGVKATTCAACNGSGRYDHIGSPKCGACNGTGKTQDLTYEYEILQQMRREGFVLWD